MLGSGLMITGQAHSDRAGLRSSWDISLWVTVWVRRVPGCLQAWLWLNWRPGLFQHSLELSAPSWTELKKSSWAHGHGREPQVRLIWDMKAHQCCCTPDTVLPNHQHQFCLSLSSIQHPTHFDTQASVLVDPEIHLINFDLISFLLLNSSTSSFFS